MNHPTCVLEYNSYYNVNTLTHTKAQTRGLDTERPEPSATDYILHTNTDTELDTHSLCDSHTHSPLLSQTHTSECSEWVGFFFFRWSSEKTIRTQVETERCDVAGVRSRGAENRVIIYLFSWLRITVMSFYRRNSCLCYYDNTWRPTVLEYTTAPRLPGGVSGVGLYVCVD